MIPHGFLDPFSNYLTFAGPISVGLNFCHIFEYEVDELDPFWVDRAVGPTMTARMTTLVGLISVGLNFCHVFDYEIEDLGPSVRGPK